MATPDMLYKHQQNVVPIPTDINYLPSAPMQPHGAPQVPNMYPNVGPQTVIVAPPSQPPPYPIPQPSHIHMHSSPSMIVGQAPIPTQTILFTSAMVSPEILLIKDYMVWSIINVFLGGFLLGMIAVLLSTQTRKRKMEGDIATARTMSTITLVFNIIVTIIFFLMTAFLIVYFVVFVSVVDNLDATRYY